MNDCKRPQASLTTSVLKPFQSRPCFNFGCAEMISLIHCQEKQTRFRIRSIFEDFFQRIALHCKKIVPRKVVKEMANRKVDIILIIKLNIVSLDSNALSCFIPFSVNQFTLNHWKLADNIFTNGLP